MINNTMYFDNNKTTATDPQVIELMNGLEATNKNRGEIINEATTNLSVLTGAQPNEVFFTRGTTPSITLGIQLTYKAFSHKGKHIITSLIEHPAVLSACELLQQQGAEITYLGVDAEGRIDIDEIKKATRPDTIMVCLMAANNETGVLLPIEETGSYCAANNIVFFTDASQFVGKQLCDVSDLNIDCMAFGSHKMYGPQGIGALFLSNKLQLTGKGIKDSLTLLIEQQNQLDTKLIAGFGKAAQIAKNDYWEMSAHISRIKNYFEHQLLDIEGLRINGSTRHRIYNTSNLYFPQAENIRTLLAEFTFLSNHNRQSHVLKAMGLTEQESKNSFRFSFGKYNTLDEVKMLCERILQICN